MDFVHEVHGPPARKPDPGLHPPTLVSKECAAKVPKVNIWIVVSKHVPPKSGARSSFYTTEVWEPNSVVTAN